MTQTVAHTIIEIETEKRVALAAKPEFIKGAIAIAKKMGINAKEWNENKVSFLMLFANKAIQIAQENGDDTFGVENATFKIA